MLYNDKKSKDKTNGIKKLLWKAIIFMKMITEIMKNIFEIFR